RSTRRIAAARAAGFSGGTSRPVSPSTTTSGTELIRAATTGSPASIASSNARPKPSQRAGWTSSDARRSHAATSGTRPGSHTRSATPSSAASASSRARSGPSPSTTSQAPGTSGNARSATSIPFCGTSRPIANSTHASTGTGSGGLTPQGSGGPSRPYGFTSIFSPARRTL